MVFIRLTPCLPLFCQNPPEVFAQGVEQEIFDHSAGHLGVVLQPWP